MVFGLKKYRGDWCCIGFKAGYGSAGIRGTAYLVGRDSLGTPEFIHQFRTVDLGKEEVFDFKNETPMSFVVDVRIVFCPSCGVNLERFYGKKIDDLNRSGFKIKIFE